MTLRRSLKDFSSMVLLQTEADIDAANDGIQTVIAAVHGSPKLDVFQHEDALAGKHGNGL